MKLFLIILFTIIISSDIYSQCGCTGAAVGGVTPIGGTANIGLLREGYMRLNLFSAYYYGNKFYSGDALANYETSLIYRTVREYHSFYNSLSVGYGIIDKLTLEAELGYYPYKVQNYIPYMNVIDGVNIEQDKSKGLSHLFLNAKYGIYQSIINEFEFTLGAGGRVPLDFKSDTAYRYVNSSNGAYGIVLQSFLHKGYKSDGLHFFLINRADINFKNEFGYKFGNSFNTSLFAAYEFPLAITGLIELNNEIRSEDMENAEPQTESGGMFLNLGTQLNYSFDQFNLSVFFRYPIYQYFNGNQIGNRFSVGLNMTWQTEL